MSEYSELQVALINARDGYEKRRSNFTAPKDKRIHKRQCDLISAHILELPELTAARDEAERLRERVIAWLRCGQCGQMEPFHASGCTTKYGEYACPSGPSLNSQHLRIKAEAVEECEAKLNRIPGAMLWDMNQVQSWLDSEAQRLRQQASDLENNHDPN